MSRVLQFEAVQRSEPFYIQIAVHNLLSSFDYVTIHLQHPGLVAFQKQLGKDPPAGAILKILFHGRRAELFHDCDLHA
jgi:hypothetical protein